jgi:hypothetical protein
LTGSRPLLSVHFHAGFFAITSVGSLPFRCVLVDRVSLCLTPRRLRTAFLLLPLHPQLVLSDERLDFRVARQERRVELERGRDSKRVGVRNRMVRFQVGGSTDSSLRRLLHAHGQPPAQGHAPERLSLFPPTDPDETVKGFAKASRQNLAFRFTPMFLEMLRQRVGPLRRPSERSPSGLARRSSRSRDRRKDESLGRFGDLKAYASSQSMLLAQVPGNHNLALRRHCSGRHSVILPHW